MPVRLSCQRLGRKGKKSSWARVLAGAGGLCAPVILYLAAAGIGTITIIDDDVYL